MRAETVIAWLWARTVTCPNPACGAQMPLVSSYWLSKKKGKAAWVEPVIDHANKRVDFRVKTGRGEPPEPTKTGRGAQFKCPVCGEIAPEQHIYDEGKAQRMGAQLMAIVTEGDRQRNYYAPEPQHVAIAEQARPEWAPHGELPKNPRWFSPPAYGMMTFADLFTPRQLVALTTFSDLVGEARAVIRQDALAAGLADDDTPLREGGTGARAYAEAVSVYLGMAASKSADNNCTLCTWMSGVKYEVVRGAFSRQAMPMTWDYAESNVFANSSGDYFQQVNRISNTLEISLPSNNVDWGLAKQADSCTVSYSNAIAVSTDPPYYDNIGYADLSDFFYIWLRGSLRYVYPEVFATLLVPKSPELVATPYRFNGDKKAAEVHFEQGLEQTFANARKYVDRDYPLTIYYAFKQQEVIEDGTASTGWETMLQALITTGFVIDGTWPMRTERIARTVSYGTNALASSIVLVCRPRPEDAPITSRREFSAALRRELPEALKQLQSGNIAPVDMAQAAIGPGMAVYSRYRRVLEANGEPLTVRTALQIINAELDAFLAEAEGGADADTRFAVAWFEQHGFAEGPYGQAETLVTARNTSVDGLVQAGIVESGGGRVRLLEPHELDPGWDPASDRRATVWEAAHHLLYTLTEEGESGSARLLLRLSSDLAADARALAYRLYSICERKGWAELARGYNALVVSWPQVAENAAQAREQQRTSGVQMDMFDELD